MANKDFWIVPMGFSSGHSFKHLTVFALEILFCTGSDVFVSGVLIHEVDSTLLVESRFDTNTVWSVPYSSNSCIDFRWNFIWHVHHLCYFKFEWCLQTDLADSLCEYAHLCDWTIHSTLCCMARLSVPVNQIKQHTFYFYTTDTFFLFLAVHSSLKSRNIFWHKNMCTHPS